MAQHSIQTIAAEIIAMDGESQLRAIPNVDNLAEYRGQRRPGRADEWVAWNRGAQSAAEELHRTLAAREARIAAEVDNLVAGRPAGWVPPTEKQLAFAASLGVAVTDGMSRCDVSAAIDAAKSGRRLFGYRGGYSPACRSCGERYGRDGICEGCGGSER